MFDNGRQSFAGYLSVGLGRTSRLGAANWRHDESSVTFSRGSPQECFAFRSRLIDSIGDRQFELGNGEGRSADTQQKDRPKAIVL